METQTQAEMDYKITPEKKGYMQAIIDRMSEDIEFRMEMTSNPLDALKPYTGLTQKEKEVLGSLRRVALEEMGLNIIGVKKFVADNGFKLSVSHLT